MRITQGTFSFLPDLSDQQIARQIDYCLENGWAVSVEYTDAPHPRNTYWEMWSIPLFDLKDPGGLLVEINECRKTFPDHYIRVSAFDATRGVESLRLSFLVNRPRDESGFVLERTETRGRTIRYTTRPWAAAKSSGRGTD